MSILELKQEITRLTQREREELRTYLLRLKHDTAASRRATSRTIRDMKKGKFATLEELESKLQKG